MMGILNRVFRLMVKNKLFKHNFTETCDTMCDIWLLCQRHTE